MQVPATGPKAYWAAVRSFSWNARLYLLHIIGMDLIHGTWETVFNLYLLALGKDVAFVGLRLLVAGVAGAVLALPAGVLCDRIGRRWSFILGDGVGAALALLQIYATADWVLLAAPVAGALFSNLHQVSEPAFMAENSAERERVHLFSVGSGLRVLAASAGALLVPAFLLALGDVDRVALYRWTTLVGVAWWFLSLVPALLLREYRVSHPARGAGDPRRGLRQYLAGVRHPVTVARFVAISGLLSLGAGFGVRLFNVFLHEHVHATDAHIGATFGAGNIALGLATLAVPFLVDRLGKVGTVVVTRLLAIPFILLFAFSRELATQAALALPLAGVAFTARILLQNMGNPAFDAFQMEQLDPAERATTVGLETLVNQGLGALGGYLGSLLMNNGLYQVPYLAMAALYLASTLAFWAWFGRDPRTAATR